MGRLQKALNALLGKEEVAPQQVQQVQPLMEEAVVEEYSQENGTLVTLDANNVSVAISRDNSNVQVERITPQNTMRKMGGEEIQPGTLHQVWLPGFVLD